MRKKQKDRSQVLTYHQVQEMLPEITFLVHEMHDSYKKTRKLRKMYEMLENSDFSEKKIIRENLEIERQLMLEYSKMEELAVEIEHLGGILQSAADGQVDFVIYKNGNRVHLCWKLGEESLKYWHFPAQACSKRKLIEHQQINKKH